VNCFAACERFGYNRATLAIEIGQQLGSYEITALLGKGGMGEVYRARDTKLKRDVAIKILPGEFSRDADRLSRFQREAEVLASLNHPNIGAIYDVQQAEEMRFLVLELVEGETLEERIQRGPIPVEEALDAAKHICEALEAAHEKGVVHRDLKPANVKITPVGRVKVLDFGLAKAFGTPPSNMTLSNSPTMLSGSMGGMIVGTAAYMSPEQARGRTADQRSDVFSFGCVLYEMLTGRQAFQGEEVSDVLAAVLKTEPDKNLLPAKMNPMIYDLLYRSLEKDRKRRWHCVSDLRVEIEAALADPHGAFAGKQPDATKPLWKRAAALLVAILATFAVTAAVMWNVRPSVTAAVARLSTVVPKEQTFTRTARHVVGISPDGANIVYVANQQLSLKPLGALEGKAIPGTLQDVESPFFSPDGRWVAFHSVTERKLKKIAITGGASVPICDADLPFGGHWYSTDEIVFGQATKGIVRVSANGGKPEPIVTAKPEETIYGPQMLPGGRAILFTTTTASDFNRWDKAQIAIEVLESHERKVVINGGGDARYVPTGHIIYALGKSLLAVPFDAHKLEVTGGPVPVLDDVMRAPAMVTAAANFSFSDNGTLVSIASGVVDTVVGRSLTLVDRAGVKKPLGLSAGPYVRPSLSPDGKQLAVSTDEGKDAMIWVYGMAGTHPCAV
jgi:serine/threonine protein kinase